MYKTLCTKDSRKKDSNVLWGESKNTKEEKDAGNPQMEKDLHTTKNDCLCPIENLSIENFCVLLAIIIVKATMKRCENLSEDKHKSNSEELFLKHLEIETELMWHIIPKNMMRGDQSFFLSLFSTSCGLVNTLIQPFQGKTSKVNSPTLRKEEIQENDSTLMSKDNTFAAKGS